MTFIRENIYYVMKPLETRPHKDWTKYPVWIGFLLKDVVYIGLNVGRFGTTGHVRYNGDCGIESRV